jgi:hypothetical protein
MPAAGARRKRPATASRLPLKEYLDKWRREAALAVHWIWVGPNGRVTRPATGGVLPYYRLCSDEPAWQVKTVVNTYYLQGLATHPHNYEYLCAAALKCYPASAYRSVLFQPVPSTLSL